MAKSKVNKRKILYWCIGIALTIYALSMLIPCWYLLINSFKTDADYNGTGDWSGTNVFGFPREFVFSNYQRASSVAAEKTRSILILYLYSILMTGIGTALGVFATVCTAYACARFQFVGKELIVSLGVGALVFPDFGSAATIYRFFQKTKLLDTWGVLWPGLNPFGLMFLIVYGQFKTISGTYAEAAKIDGASELRIMVQIMVPMIKGVIGMMVVMSAIGSWNNYYTTFMYLPSKPTIAYAMYKLNSEPDAKEMPVLCAIMVLCIIPLVVLFITMRDTIISNTAAGGLKG